MVIETGQNHGLTQLCAAIDTNLMIQFTIHSKKLGQKYFQVFKVTLLTYS